IACERPASLPAIRLLHCLPEFLEVWLASCSPSIWIFEGRRWTKLSKWIFVGAGSVNRRHGNFEHAQIDGELSAMVVEMIHEDGAKERDAGDGHQGLSVSRKTPHGDEARVVHLRQRFRRAYETLRKRIQNFLSIPGLWLRKAGSFEGVRHRCRSDASWHRSNV